MPESANSKLSSASPTLTASQLAALAELGEERTANVGEVLYRVGDARYPFIVILKGEVAILDAAGNEILRHGRSGFLGELNLLSGQTVFVTAVVTQPLHYIAVGREALRSLLFEDEALSDLVVSTFIARREALQRVHGIGLEIVGPRSSRATIQMLDFARSNRLPYRGGRLRRFRGPRHARGRKHGIGRAGGCLTANRELSRLPGRDHRQ